MQALLDISGRHLPRGFGRRMNDGMPACMARHNLSPDGHHDGSDLPLHVLSVASPKSNLDAHPSLRHGFAAIRAKASAKKLEMSKSCIRCKQAGVKPAQG